MEDKFLVLIYDYWKQQKQTEIWLSEQNIGFTIGWVGDFIAETNTGVVYGFDSPKDQRRFVLYLDLSGIEYSLDVLHKSVGGGIYG